MSYATLLPPGRTLTYKDLKPHLSSVAPFPQEFISSPHLSQFPRGQSLMACAQLPLSSPAAFGVDCRRQNNGWQRRGPPAIGRSKENLQLCRRDGSASVSCHPRDAVAVPQNWRREDADPQPEPAHDPSLSAKLGSVAAQSASGAPQPYGVPERGAEPEQWDVVGLGQAMVDFSAMVPDDFLTGLGLQRGERVVVDHHGRGEVLQALDGCSYKLSAGGSLSNTLVALARLGAARPLPNTGVKSSHRVPATRQQQGLHVAMVGSVGSDALGDFYRTKLLRANVHFLSPSIQGGTTGTVIVLTTPDTQRTMLAYQGMSSEVSWDSAMASVVAKSRVLMVEGYLWELPQTVDAIEEACAAARSKGLLVALTASDVTCVLRHRAKFWNVLCRSAHILFANVQEARALAGPDCPESSSPADLAQYLSRFCPLVAVTDGEQGSYLGLKEQVVHIPAFACAAKDSCGAGDAYAAGVLYALLMGAPHLEGIGAIASRVASVVVSQQGARLSEDDATQLAHSFALSERALADGAVFRSMVGLQSTEVSGVALNAHLQ